MSSIVGIGDTTYILIPHTYWLDVRCQFEWFFPSYEMNAGCLEGAIINVEGQAAFKKSLF